MNNNLPNSPKKPNYVGLFFLAYIFGLFGLPTGIIVLLIWAFMTECDFSNGIFVMIFLFGIVLTVLGLIGLFVTKRDDRKIAEQKAMEEILAKEKRKQEEARKKAEEESLRRKIAEGEWIFPVAKREALYLECRKGGVTSLSTAYARQKARTVILSMLDEEKIPKEYQSLYSTDQRIEQYFEMGKTAVEISENTPHAGVLTESEQQQVAEAQELSRLFGLEKRRAIVGKKIGELRKQVANRARSAQSMQDLGVLLATSAAKTPKNDWATLGGIANGIAGPGAGVAAALNAMADNARIEQNSAAANRMGAELWSHSYSTLDSINELERKIKELSEIEEDTKKKVVLTDVKNTELMKALQITSQRITKTSGNALVITATVRNDYRPPNVPADVKMTIDGTLTADVYCNKISVGKAILPLPFLGVECGKATEITGICCFSLEGSRQYTFSLSPNNLWVMEV